MTPEQLKASILQYAIQGKLVEQRQEEGTGEELYQQIQEEKQRLIKDGKIKKEKPLPEIKDDEIPFDIPESWKWVKLQNIIHLLGDGLHGTPEYVENSEYFFVNGNNLINGKVVIKNNTKFISKETYEKNKKDLNSNTIFVSINGTLGNLSFYDNEKIMLGKSVCYFNLSFLVNKFFVYYTLMGNYFSKYYQNQSTRTTINNISLNSMRNLPIPLPPLAEQKRIVSKIEELLPHVERYAVSYEKLEQLNAKFPEQIKKSILQYAIQGKLVEQRPEEGTGEELYQQIQEEKQRLIKEGKIKKEKPLPEIKDDEIPFDIPESWKWVRLHTVGITQTGNTPSKDRKEYFGSYIPFLGPGDIKIYNVDYENQGLSEEGVAVGRTTPANSILQVCIGGSIGKCALVDRKVSFNQQINSIYPILANSKFIYMILDSYFFKKCMLDKAGGTATPIINRNYWDSITIPLPPFAEQERIVAKIEELLFYYNRLPK